MSRNTLAENEVLIGKFKAVVECLANETCALILERSGGSASTNNSQNQGAGVPDRYVLLNSGIGTVGSSPAACLWKLRSVLEVAPEPKFGANMIMSPTAQAAWQEHRRTLPLAEFPTEMFDPRSTLLNNHEQQYQQQHQQWQEEEASAEFVPSRQIFVEDNDERNKQKKTREKKKKKILKEKRPFGPHRHSRR
jgi:hypothetical protein